MESKYIVYFNLGQEALRNSANTLVPLTQLHGGGPTQASVCINGKYISGKLFVNMEGTVVFLQNEEYANPRESDDDP